MDISGIDFNKSVHVMTYTCIANVNIDEVLKIKKNDPPFIVECDIGFYGNNCIKHCDYPFYGAKCVLKCNCPKEECHFINGCRDHHIEGILLEIMLDHI